MDDSHHDQPVEGLSRRLWTPWRMQYVGGGTKEPGCVFCNRLSADNDVESLILHRGTRAFAIMNLFPYNTGHTMLIPNEHVASPEETSAESLAEMAILLPPLLRASRRALACHGFNVGLNVGSVAGAGVAEHMHQHVVPRWNGDANFMPIIGATMVIPELIPVTYAKIRAELTRELVPAPPREMAIVILDSERRRVLVQDDNALPRVSLEPERSAVQTALSYALDSGLNASLAGWAGPTLATPAVEIALTLVAGGEPTGDHRWVATTNVDSQEWQAILQRIQGNLAPALGS